VEYHKAIPHHANFLMFI